MATGWDENWDLLDEIILEHLNPECSWLANENGWYQSFTVMNDIFLFVPILIHFLAISRSFLVKSWKCAYRNIVCSLLHSVHVVVNIVHSCSISFIHKNIIYLFSNKNEWDISFITIYYCSAFLISNIFYTNGIFCGTWWD